MHRQARRAVATLFFFSLLMSAPARGADPEIDMLLRSPVGKDWVTNGGNLTNNRYSTLKQIDTTNVGKLKGAWMTRLKGSGVGGEYSLAASPPAPAGPPPAAPGPAAAPAPNEKTGEILWEYWSGIEQNISTVCCGRVNRGLAMGDGLIYLGQLDANVAALDMKTGKVAWKTPIEKWQNGYGITSAPRYYDGLIYTGITGGEFGVRGRMTALDAKTGEIKWRWFTLPGPGEKGSAPWPPGTAHAMRGGAAIWNTPAVDPELGLLYFAVGNCGPDYDGSMREGDNLFCTSMVALKAKTGEYAWHFQQVHHDIWDYDAASPVVLFDTVIDGQPRKGIAEAGRTGWVYILDRTNGKPLIGIDEKPVPQEPRQKTAATQPIPVGDPVVPQCAEKMPGYDEAGCLYTPFWESPVLIQPSGVGGTNWSPMPYSPDTGYLYVPGTVRTSAYTRNPTTYTNGVRYTGGGQAAPIGSPMTGTFTAIDAKTNKIAWQHKSPYRVGGGGGSTVTAGGLVLRGDPDGNFLALDAKTGQERRRGRTGGGADAPPVVYEVDGEEYIAIATGGNQMQGSAYGDAVWTFSLKGQLGPLWAPPPPQAVAGRAGRGAGGAAAGGGGAGGAEYSFSPSRTRIKSGTTVSFTNVGDIPHDSTSLVQTNGWSTGAISKGETKTVKFDKPGIYYYICSPHPWMYG